MNATKASNLGKGLSALMGEQSPKPTTVKASKPTKETFDDDVEENSGTQGDLAITSLKQGKYQPRTNFRLDSLQELSDSIRTNGIMQPILVRPVGNKKYEIVAGERRWRAAKLADLQSVPVIIREMDDKTALELAIVENIQRSDLTPIEEAAGYQRLMEEFDYTQEILAESVGKSRSHVANLIRLLGLPEEVKERLDNGEIAMGHARALVGIENAVELAEQIVEKGLNVRQAEALAKRDPSKPVGRPRGAGHAPAPAAYTPPTNKDPDLILMEQSLSENLGIQVAIEDTGGSAGKISLHYTTLEELDDVLRRLGDSSV